MWIERLEIAGFRRLSGEFEFARTLTVVVGDNEAGKTTLHDALVRTLFGFSKAERRRSGGSSLLERGAPWEGGPYRVAATVHADGRAYRIEWDFAEHRARLLDELGQDLSHEIRGRGDDVALGEHLLGMGLNDFRQVCCIDQDALFAVRHSPSLELALQQAVANVAGDTPVASAQARLDDFLRNTIGARVDNLRQTPTGRLAQLEGRRTELQTAIRESEEVREHLVALARDAAQAREDKDRLVGELSATRSRIRLTELRALETQLERARALEAKVADRPEASLVPRADAVAAVRMAQQQLADLSGPLEAAERDVTAVAETVSTLEARERDLAAAIEDLGASAGVDDSLRARVQDRWAHIQALGSEPVDEPAVPRRDRTLERYRGERSELLALARRRRFTVRRVLWFLLVVLTLGLAWGVRALVRRLRRLPSRSLYARLDEYGVRSLDHLEGRAADEDRRIEKAEAVVEAFRKRREETAVRIAGLEVGLRSDLDAAGAPPAEDLRERVQSYLAAIDRRTQVVGKEVELERLRRELQDARRPSENRLRLVDERDRAERRLREAYVTLGIDAAHLRTARAELEALVERAGADEARARSADEAAAALGALLGGESIERLEARLSEARARVESAGESLAPGDALYIPALWWHDVLSLEDFGSLINFWWRDAEPPLLSPLYALYHAIITMKDLPPNELKAWRNQFDHYVFGDDGDPVAHLPEAARGVLDKRTPELVARVKKLLIDALS